MTADEYLKRTGKRPFATELTTNAWYWGDEGDWDPGVDPEDYTMVVPSDVFAVMGGRLTYPNCHVYGTEEEAVEAFIKAWNVARGETQ